MMQDLDSYQIFFSNSIFFGLFLTMCLYWISLIFFEKKIIYKLAILGSKTCTVILSLYLSWRWYKYQYFPLSNLYESLMFLICLLLLLSLFIEYKTKSKLIGSLILPLIVLTEGFASLSLPISMQKSSPLVPALQSNWLMLHVSMMMLSYATLLIGSLLSIFYLILYKKNNLNIEQSNNENILNKSNTYLFQVKSTPLAFNQISNLSDDNNIKLSKIKLLNSLDNWSYRIIGLGFPFLTMGIISGAVWANEAWGSYWSWDPKETWALITWLVYAAYLHARLTKGWYGRTTALIASLGFVIVWICYLGVNFLGKGLHSYGWLT